MVQKATREDVTNSTRPPDSRWAVQQVRHAIREKKTKISSLNGEIADIFGKIEGKGLNKVGVRLFMILDKLEPDERVDCLRTLNGMADVAEWPENTEDDLVDQAEDNVVALRVGKPAPASEAAEQELAELEQEQGGGVADDFTMSDDELAQQTIRGRADGDEPPAGSAVSQEAPE